MSGRAWKICSTTGCPTVVPPGTSRCDECTRTAEQRRGSARARGYDQRHARRFRSGVLRRDPLCVCTEEAHGHGAPCLSPSRHADHHPRSRREVEQLGLDPNDPQHGRGLCHSCHSKRTAQDQPGGWNARHAQ